MVQSNLQFLSFIFFSKHIGYFLLSSSLLFCYLPPFPIINFLLVISMKSNGGSWGNYLRISVPINFSHLRLSLLFFLYWRGGSICFPLSNLSLVSELPRDYTEPSTTLFLNLLFPILTSLPETSSLAYNHDEESFVLSSKKHLIINMFWELVEKNNMVPHLIILTFYFHISFLHDWPACLVHFRAKLL